MSTFKNFKKKDEYDRLYDYDDDICYEELYENEDPEELIDKLRGNIGRGDCLYCDGKNTMEYEGHICFICAECGKSVHEDIYYRWAAGYDVEFEN